MTTLPRACPSSRYRIASGVSVTPPITEQPRNQTPRVVVERQVVDDVGERIGARRLSPEELRGDRITLRLVADKQPTQLVPDSWIKPAEYLGEGAAGAEPTVAGIWTGEGRAASWPI